MLVSFKVSNFLSFSKPQTISMVPSLDSLNNVITFKDVRLLKMGVIFGANSSGKSNLLKAIAFGKELVKGNLIKKSKNWYSKVDSEYKLLDSNFEYTFLFNNKFYSYGFYINLAEFSITSEYLYEVSHDETLIFERDVKNSIDTFNLEFTQSESDVVNNILENLKEDPSSLFIQKINDDRLKDTSKEVFQDIFNWFNIQLKIYNPKSDFTTYEYTFLEDKTKFTSLLKEFDVGITDLLLSEISIESLKEDINDELYLALSNELKERAHNNPNYAIGVNLNGSLYNILSTIQGIKIFKVSLIHENLNVEFDFSEESDGTRRMFDLLDIILAPTNGAVYIFDELDRSMHPLITKKYINIFNKILKDLPVQLLFTTHEASLLSIDSIRKDEVWFVEKMKDNSSKLFSLDIFENLQDKDLASSYLKGFYGAIPIITDNSKKEES